MNNDLKTSFDKLWELGEADMYIYDSTVVYDTYNTDFSSTPAENLGKIMQQYGNLVGKNIEYNYEYNPSFYDFKRSIDEQQSIAFGYKLKEGGGHGVNIVGYCEGTMGDKKLNYIVAADGWHDDAPRYVLYSEFLFEATTITSFSIEK